MNNGYYWYISRYVNNRMLYADSNPWKPRLTHCIPIHTAFLLIKIANIIIRTSPTSIVIFSCYYCIFCCSKWKGENSSSPFTVRWYCCPPLHNQTVLSNGEQFRAGLARLLLSDEKAVVLDEFTSVIDRQVARIASGAFQKACGWLLRTLCCLLFVPSARVFYRKLVVFLCWEGLKYV